MKYFILLVVAFIGGCDFIDLDYSTLHIEGDYYFSDLGGDETMIIKKNNSDLNDVVVDSRVDNFIMLNKQTLAVARTPRIIRENNNGVTSVLLDKCEYWVIDIVVHSIAGPFDIDEYIGQVKMADSNFSSAARTLTCE